MINAERRLSGPAARAWPVKRFGQLHSASNRVVDKNGQPVVLRGMSLFWSQWQSRFFTRETIQWLRDDWCIDVVRVPLGVHLGGYLEHPKRELAKVQTAIEAAIDCGLYVIVDWHAHEPELAAAVEFFTWVSREYGAAPNVIYETWNEPHGRYSWRQDIKPYHQTVVSSIRELDPSNLIIAGTPHWSHRVDQAAADPLAFNDIVYTLHFYAGTHGRSLRLLAQVALQYGVALMVTEWGTCGADGNGAINSEETRRWWQFLEENMIGYVNWSISDKAETASAVQACMRQAGWSVDALTPSGRLVRAQLRRMAASLHIDEFDPHDDLHQVTYK